MEGMVTTRARVPRDMSNLSHPAMVTPLSVGPRKSRVSVSSLPAGQRQLVRCPIFRSVSVVETPVWLDLEVEEEGECEADGALWRAPLREVVRAMAWDKTTGVLWLRMDDSKGKQPLLRFSSTGVPLGRVGRGIIQRPGQWTYGLCVDVKRHHVILTDGSYLRAIDTDTNVAARELTFRGAGDLWRVDYVATDDVYVVIERAGDLGSRERVCVIHAETGCVRAHFSVPGEAPMLCSRFLSLASDVITLVDQFSYCVKEMSLSGELLRERDLTVGQGFTKFTGMCLDREGRAIVATVGQGVARITEDGEGGRWESLLSPHRLGDRHLISTCVGQEDDSSESKLFVITNGHIPKYKVMCYTYH